MPQTNKAGPGGRENWLIAVCAVAALTLAGTTFYAVQKLSGDDCTTETRTMPDGSRVATKTCS